MIPYKLLDWIPESALYPDALSTNRRAICIIEKYPERIDWPILSRNPAAIHLLEKNIDSINWSNLSSNPAAIHLLKTHPDKIDWFVLSSNPAAIDLIKQNLDKISWRQLSKNTNPEAMQILEKSHFKVLRFDWSALCKNPNAMSIIDTEWRATKMVNWFYKLFSCWCHCKTRCLIEWASLCANTNPEAIQMLKENFKKIRWDVLSSNPSAMSLLEQYPENIDWNCLSSNTAAIHLIEKKLQENRPNYINFHRLSANPEAIHLLKKYPEHISWYQLSKNTNPEAMQILEKQCKGKCYQYWFVLSGNSNIFTYDYEKMLQTKSRLHEELIQNMFHPKNIGKFEDWGFLNGWSEKQSFSTTKFEGSIATEELWKKELDDKWYKNK